MLTFYCRIILMNKRRCQPFCTMLLQAMKKCFIATPMQNRLLINLTLNGAVILFNHLGLQWPNLCVICTAFICVFLFYHITQFFPQQGRLRGPAKPRMPTTAPHFFVFMKKLQLRGGVEGRTLENVVQMGSYG